MMNNLWKIVPEFANRRQMQKAINAASEHGGLLSVNSAEKAYRAAVEASPSALEDAGLVNGVAMAIAAERNRNSGTTDDESPSEVDINYARAVLSFLDYRRDV